MKRWIMLSVVLGAVSCFAGADEALKIERGKRVIAEMEEVFVQIQERVDGITQELLLADAAVEKKISGLVKMMSSLKDSSGSGNRIARSKMQLIEGLERSIKFYAQRRAKNMDDLMRPHTAVSKDDLKGDADRLEARVDKRIEQIMQITQSFTQHEDYDKYLYQNRGHYSSMYDGGGVRQIQNPKYKQNRKVARVGENTRARLMEEIQQALNGLQRDVVLMQQKVRYAQTREEYDLRSEEVAKVEARIAQLTKNIHELAVPAAAPQTREVGGQKAAHTLDLQLRNAIAGIQQDYRSMLAKKSQLDLERTRLHTLDVKLAYNRRLMKTLQGTH